MTKSIYKKIISLFLIFLLTFNFTLYNYNKTTVMGADIALTIGGVAYGAKEVAAIVLALLGISGGAYIVNENRDNIEQMAVNTAQSFNKFLETSKDKVVYTSQMFGEWLDNSYNKVKECAQVGVDATVQVSTDLYYSFKEFINNCMSESPTQDNFYVPSFNTKIYTNTINSANLEDSRVQDIINHADTYSYIGTSCTYKGNVQNSFYPARPYIFYNEYYLYPKELISIETYPWSNTTTRYTFNLKCFRNNDPSLSNYYYPYQISVDNDCPSIDLYLFGITPNLGSIPIENPDTPEWREPLTNNDVKIRGVDGNGLIDNYDVISFGHSVVGDDVIVGDRTISIPRGNVLEDLYQRYLNGELTYQEYITLVNKAVGVVGVDTTADGVIVTDKGVTVPLDTPIWDVQDKEDTDTPTLVKDVIGGSTNDVNKGTMSDFPDLSQLFPFCIPFDVLRLLKIMVAEPETPHFEIPINAPWINVEYTIVVDFEQFETLSHITRTFLAISWIVFLIVTTRKLIKS